MRVTEHKRTTKTGDLNNNIAEHHLKTSHSIDWDSATCLSYSTDYYQWIILENGFTDLLTEQTALNCCQHLPPPYKRLLNTLVYWSFYNPSICIHTPPHTSSQPITSRIYQRLLSPYQSNLLPGFLNFQLRLPHRLSKRQSLTTVLLRTPISQMIFFHQSMLLLGSNHFPLIITTLMSDPLCCMTETCKFWLSFELHFYALTNRHGKPNSWHLA